MKTTEFQIAVDNYIEAFSDKLADDLENGIIVGDDIGECVAASMAISLSSIIRRTKRKIGAIMELNRTDSWPEDITKGK